MRGPEPPPRPAAHLWPWIILAVATLLRLALVLYKGQHFHFADTAEYDAAARSILAGHGIGERIPRAPLYPAFMALSYALFGTGNLMGVRLLQLPLGVGVVGLTMWLGTRVGGRATGLLAGAAAAVAPTLVYSSTMLYPTALYTVILLGITAGALALRHSPGYRRAVGLGVLIALAWFTDQVVLFTIVAILATIACDLPREGARLARPLALAVLVALGGVIPVAAWQHRTHGTPAFFLEKAEYVMFVARHEGPAVGGHMVRDTSAAFVALKANDFLRREAGLFARQPGAYLRDYGYEFLHFFKPYPDRIQTANRFTSAPARWLVVFYFLPVLPLALVGLLRGAAPGRDRALLVAIPIATAATYALFFTQVRYRVPTEPQLLVLAALGALIVARRLARGNRPATR